MSTRLAPSVARSQAGTMCIAVVDPGSGNLASVLRALDRAAERTGCAIAAAVTRDPAEVAAADRIILPGQGAFAACMRGLAPGSHAYFVHSYALAGGDAREVAATTEYGGPVVALVARGNIAGTQFHVEKSGETGLAILANFLRWTP